MSTLKRITLAEQIKDLVAERVDLMVEKSGLENDVRVIDARVLDINTAVDQKFKEIEGRRLGVRPRKARASRRKK